MSAIEKPVSKSSLLQAEQVVDYLWENLDFFQNHPRLLADLLLPHETHGAVSLVERQVAVLREQNSNYKRNLQELIEIARENDHLNQLIHELTLGLLESQNTQLIVETVQHSLHCDFDIDVVVIRLFESAAELENSELQTDEELRTLISEILLDEKPLCGKLDDESCLAIFGEQANGIESTALVPLSHMGILAMGSFDASRFRANMGSVFLSQLGELISKALDRHWNN
jgi:uncharacterized protein